MKPLPLQEREYRQGLYHMERRAGIPIKWFVLLVTVILWFWTIGSAPSPHVFLLFFLYFLFILAQSYFFYFSKVTLTEVKPLVIFSYFVDVVFVTLLIYFDLATNNTGPSGYHDFYLLYFLLVMRGFALFQSLTEIILVNILISMLYLLTLGLQKIEFRFLYDSNFAVSLVLIWLVILMSWFIISTITRQKMELLDIHDRLLRTDNLARVGELAAGVAHEINNPIGIIAATAEYLKKRLEPGDERLDDIEAIYSEAMRCKEIVQEMLTYANPRPIGSGPLDMRAINEEVLHFVFPNYKADLYEVIREYDEDVPIFMGDANLIKQALLNLYINARQAIPPDVQGRIVSRVQSRQRGRSVAIEIEDNGVGIDEPDMDHIFEPFFTRKAEGTGLGLAVTQRIIEMFKGTIKIRRGERGGTCFTLTFPAVQK
ncbi:MAG: ATP-binding protein [bacterium]|nr:ATP-binding protein [bacterium]